jgi:hypothetical protein
MCTYTYVQFALFWWWGLTCSLWIFEKFHRWNVLITKWHFIHSNFNLLLVCYFKKKIIEILDSSFNLVLEVYAPKMPCVLQGALKLPCVHYRLLKSNTKKVDYSFFICLLLLPCLPLKNVLFRWPKSKTKNLNKYRVSNFDVKKFINKFKYLKTK